jgi:hypothetical protein
MKRLLLSLWFVGAVLYAISTLLLTSSIWFSDDDDPKPIAKDVFSTSPAYLKLAKVEPAETAPAQPEQFEPINPAAADTSHSGGAGPVGSAGFGKPTVIRSGWTQIVDPSSGHRGWIDSTILAPLTPTVDTAATEDSKQMSANEAAGALIDSKPTAKAYGSNRHYGRRRFAFRFGLMRFRR